MKKLVALCKEKWHKIIYTCILYNNASHLRTSFLVLVTGGGPQGITSGVSCDVLWCDEVCRSFCKNRVGGEQWRGGGDLFMQNRPGNTIWPIKPWYVFALTLQLEKKLQSWPVYLDIKNKFRNISTGNYIIKHYQTYEKFTANHHVHTHTTQLHTHWLKICMHACHFKQQYTCILSRAEGSFKQF